MPSTEDDFCLSETLSVKWAIAEKIGNTIMYWNVKVLPPTHVSKYMKYLTASVILQALSVEFI